MGTTEPENTEKVRGVIRMAHGTVEVVADTAYGDTKQRRSLYPLLLIVGTALLIIGGWGPAALVPLVLLALWVGGSGR